jgi:maltose/moltooligosaccharide transporter
MKLNYRRTILVGFAFLSICAFWQMYNNVIPLILTDTFHLNETYSGIIMAADNVLALFLLPFFGGLSDKCTRKSGRRMPYITAGTLLAVVLMMLLPLLDNSYFFSPTGWKKALFIVVLGLLLVAMGTYRSPAVALMPDVTPKPLRSAGNAVINLMGALGGVLYLVVASVLYSARRTDGLAHVDYVPLFGVVAGIMLLCLLILRCTIRERELCRIAQSEELSAQGEPEEKESREHQKEQAALSQPVRRSLGFLLVSIALWFIGYNAVETWFTTYADQVWGMSLGASSLCLTVATGGAIISYIPVGMIAERIGRKRSILFGVLLLAASFTAAFVYTLFYSRFSPGLYLLFVCVGVAWAFINVNSLPMVVEMCRGSEVGKFTGYYYTFSMAAQTVTPILAGFLLRNVCYEALFPYCAIFVGLSFVTMLFVRHGDTKLPRHTSPIEYLNGEDQ